MVRTPQSLGLHTNNSQMKKRPMYFAPVLVTLMLLNSISGVYGAGGFADWFDSEAWSKWVEKMREPARNRKVPRGFMEKANKEVGFFGVFEFSGVRRKGDEHIFLVRIDL